MPPPRTTPRKFILLQGSAIDSESSLSYLLARSTSFSISQTPQLSPTILVVLTAGAIALLSILAIGLYCCTRCRRRNKSRQEKLSRRLGKGSRGELEKGRVIGSPVEAGRGSLGSGNGIASPSALEFSPPSPTWRPTLPSIAYISSNPSAKGIANGLASGRGQILDAETIMNEREPGRRKVYGGGGWADIPVSAVISSISPGNQNSVSTKQLGNAHSSQLSRNGGLRVGIGTSAAPPLPSQAPRTYKPPSYHRRSRIIPVHQDAHTNPSNSAANDPNAEPGRGRNFASKSQSSAVPVPRIAVHLAQDTPNRTVEKQTKRRSRSMTSKSDGLRRNSSTASQSSRPVSGLGITTLNLGRGYGNSRSRRSVAGSRNLVPRPASPASPSDDDVRLAYRSSAVSIDPGSASPSEKPGSSASNKSTSRDKRVTRPYPSLAKKPRTATFMEEERNTSQSVSRSAPSGQSTASKRQGLGAGVVDQTVKAELHDMRSLGSESFDNLIAYLDETLEDEDDKLRHTESRSTVEHNGRLRESLAENNLERKKTMTKSRLEKETRVTREETTRVEKESYDTWVGSLHATPSELRLAHVDVEPSVSKNGRMSLRAGRRRSRSASESVQRNVQRTNKTHGKAESVPRVPLGERDINVDRQGMHGRNQSMLSSDTSRNGKKAKVGMHVRDLRARSASLKVTSEDKSEVLARHGIATDPETLPGTLAASRWSSRRSAITSSATSQTRPVIDQRQNITTEEEPTRPSAILQEPLSTLPSFSVPSTATQLYAAYPTSEESSRALSASGDSSNSDLGRNPRRVATKQASVRSKAPALPATSTSRTVCVSSSSASNSKAISSAAYIARCAPTPHFKSAAVMSFLAPSPSSASRQRLPSSGLSRSRSRLSCDSAISSDSACSATSAWGRRSEWVRESLTPRFDHLRAVLEGSLEEMPPPPVPLLAKRRSKAGMR